MVPYSLTELVHHLNVGGSYIDQDALRDVAKKVVPLLSHRGASCTYAKTGFRTQLQDGPTCGMVALSMASEQLQPSKLVTVDDLLSKARDLEFTLQGEMFSAEYVAVLAKKMLDVDATVMNLRKPNAKATLVHHVCRKDAAVLIAYDTDRNHAPCNVGGTKAHWALLTGIILERTASYIFNNHSQMYPDTTAERVFYFKTSPPYNTKSGGQVYIVAAHGKSKRLQAWPLEDLLESNAQLTTVEDKRNNYNYIIPRQGIEHALSGQCVLLTKKKFNTRRPANKKR